MPSAYNAAGKACRRYLPHLDRACVLVGYSPSWKAKAVAQAAKGLARAEGHIRAPNPAGPRALSVKILSRNSLPSGFAQAIRFRWAALPRAQSGRLPLVCCLARKWSKVQPRKFMAVIGRWQGQLATTLCGQRHMVGGPGAIRRSICENFRAGELEIHAPRPLRPVCSLREHGCNAARGGGRLSPELTRPSSADRPGCAARHLGWEWELAPLDGELRGA